METVRSVLRFRTTMRGVRARQRISVCSGAFCTSCYEKRHSGEQAIVVALKERLAANYAKEGG
jgi:hypothetical protein